eukprot:scaffold58057_cov86-Phaeocystis_antarctica.AAC.2
MGLESHLRRLDVAENRRHRAPQLVGTRSIGASTLQRPDGGRVGHNELRGHQLVGPACRQQRATALHALVDRDGSGVVVVSGHRGEEGIPRAQTTEFEAPRSEPRACSILKTPDARHATVLECIRNLGEARVALALSQDGAHGVLEVDLPVERLAHQVPKIDRGRGHDARHEGRVGRHQSIGERVGSPLRAMRAKL